MFNASTDDLRRPAGRRNHRRPGRSTGHGPSRPQLQRGSTEEALRCSHEYPPIRAGLLAAATTAALVGGAGRGPRRHHRWERSTEELTMSGRIRLLWAGLLTAATTAAMVGAPAMIQAGITFNFIE